MHKALDRKVWLPSGGSLIIEHTEALTVIDVNTGKNVGTSSLEETVFHNNLEAAEEIAKQLRLRDIGGIIVIDFIDMEIRANREKVVEVFRNALARDKTRSQVFAISDLGLVEMTRKRIGEGLLRSSPPRARCARAAASSSTTPCSTDEPAERALEAPLAWPVAMYAVISAGANQQKVAEGEQVLVDLLDANEGDEVSLTPRASWSTATPCSPRPTSSPGSP